MSQKKAVIPFLILFVTISSAYGQDSLLSEDSRALQFRITDNFNLSSFTGSLFSYKWHISSDNAHRIGLSLNTVYAERDDTFGSRGEIDLSNLDFNIFINFSWMHYLNPGADMKFYYGYGPGVSLGYSQGTNSREDGSKLTGTTKRYAIAALGYAGVEWFFHHTMSLHAEYGASLRFSYRNREIGISETEDKVVRAGGDGVKFGISVYF